MAQITRCYGNKNNLSKNTFELTRGQRLFGQSLFTKFGFRHVCAQAFFLVFSDLIFKSDVNMTALVFL
jgi:hypothetical protein